MRYGSLSTNAIRALNRGAKLGGFAHNTGEGGLSPHHLQEGGDLVWQIGTGYFGCHDDEGNFDPARFAEKAAIENVEMIEIKLKKRPRTSSPRRTIRRASTAPDAGRRARAPRSRSKIAMGGRDGTGRDGTGRSKGTWQTRWRQGPTTRQRRSGRIGLVDVVDIARLARRIERRAVWLAER